MGIKSYLSFHYFANLSLVKNSSFLNGLTLENWAKIEGAVSNKNIFLKLHRPLNEKKNLGGYLGHLNESFGATKSIDGCPLQLFNVLCRSQNQKLEKLIFIQQILTLYHNNNTYQISDIFECCKRANSNHQNGINQGGGVEVLRIMIAN